MNEADIALSDMRRVIDPVADLLNDRRPIDLEIAVDLARMFGTSALLWRRLWRQWASAAAEESEP